MSTRTPSPTSPTDTPVAVGAGTMGGPMAAGLLAAGFDVHAWNRSPRQARDPGRSRSRIARDPAEAVAEAVAVALAERLALERSSTEQFKQQRRIATPLLRRR